MSALVPDLMVYEYVQNGLNYAVCNKVIDAMYSPVVSKKMKGKLWDREVNRLVRSWAKLNADSYDAAYGREKPEDVRPFEGFVTCNRLIKTDAIQLVKYLECISYNIELATIQVKLRELHSQEIDDYNFLNAWRQDMYKAIVKSMPAYDKALWSEYDAMKIA